MRALRGAAVSMRGGWGLVHARMRGRAVGGERGMGGGVLRRREPDCRGRVLGMWRGGAHEVRGGYTGPSFVVQPLGPKAAELVEDCN